MRDVSIFDASRKKAAMGHYRSDQNFFFRFVFNDFCGVFLIFFLLFNLLFFLALFFGSYVY